MAGRKAKKRRRKSPTPKGPVSEFFRYRWCEDCELRGALGNVGQARRCGECKDRKARERHRCQNLRCVSGCEACGGTGRVAREIPLDPYLQKK